MGAIDDAFTSLFFGEPGWILGLLLFFSISIALLLKWKYSAIFIIPIVIGLEEMYYTKLQATPNTYRYAWPMVILIIFLVFIAYFLITGKDKH